MDQLNTLRGARKALSLIELIVALCVLFILCGILLPALGRARAASTQTICVANMRSCGLLLENYAHTSKEALPFGGYSLVESMLPDVGIVRYGGVSGFTVGAWSFLFLDEWKGNRWNPALRCPRQPLYDPGAILPDLEALITPQFHMSDAVWLDEQRLTPKPHHVSDIMFPSKKGLLIENPSFCVGTSAGKAELEEFRQTYREPATTLLCDGSVVRRAMKDMIQPSHGLPVVCTAEGIRGRDLR